MRLTFLLAVAFTTSAVFADLEITSLGKGVNSRYDELAPVLSPDGKTIFFCREGHPDNVGVRTIVDGASALRDDQDIWVSRKKADGTWSEAEHIAAPFNSRTYDFPVGTSADGNTLYIGNVYSKDGKVSPGVSKTRFSKGKWSFPEPLRIQNFYNEANLVNYSLSADERTLILNLQRKDTVGKMDLYVSFLQPDDTWSEPMNLGNEINSAFMEVTPFLASDNKTLYFASNRPGGVGQFDMYMSRRQDNTWTHWTNPINLGPKINTTGNDINYVIATTGDYAIFARKDRASADWYVGGVNDATERTLSLRFDFLDPGKTYTATIYKDGEGATYLTDARHRIAYDNIRVKKGDTYRLWLAPGGGAAMRLHPGR